MRDVLVLCYHAISYRWGAALSSHPDRLRAQLELLISHGYQGSTFTDAVREPRDAKTLVVSFDDAFRSVLEHAKPVLDDLGLPGTIFVPTAFPDRKPRLSWPGIDHWDGTEHEHELVTLSWRGLAEMADAGWEVGSHTRTHPYLTLLDDSELEWELAESRRECEAALGIACRSLAYPYGDHDARVAAATRAAGYEAAATLQPWSGPASMERWPRVGVYRRDTLRRFRLKVMPMTRRLSVTAAWQRMAELKGLRH